MSVTDGQDLDEEFDEEELYDDEPSPQPWHNSTPAMLGASAVGVALIAIVFGVISLVTGPSDPPADPFNFVEPSYSTTASRTSTTTATVTSTTALSTTEINAPLAPPTTSGTSGTSTSGSSESSSPPSQEEDEDEPTTRRGPRTNVTRTLIPRPVG